MNPWFQNEEEHNLHRDMMLDPRQWPKGETEVLAVKNPALMETIGSQDTAFGVIEWTGINKDHLILHQGHGANRRQINFDGVEALMADGWVVD